MAYGKHLITRAKAFKKERFRDRFFKKEGDRIIIPMGGEALSSEYNPSWPNEGAVSYLMEAVSDILSSEEFSIEGAKDKEEMFKSYFKMNAKKTIKEKKGVYILALILFIAGVVILSFSIYGMVKNIVLSEAVNILGWFLIWEGADYLIFKIGDLRGKEFILLRLIESKWI